MADNPNRPPLRKEPLLPTLRSKLPKPSRTQKILSFLVRPWSITVEVLSLIAALVVFFEIYIHTVPDIAARDSDPTSSFVLPFKVANKSLIFDMNSVTLTCGIELAVFENEAKQKYGVGDVILDADKKIEKIGRNSSANYNCDASGVLRAQTDGALVLGGLKTPPGATNSKLTLVAMCIWIGAKYKTAGFQRAFQSDIWGWYVTPDGHHQWIEGPLAGGMSKEYLCERHIEGPFMRLQSGGKRPVLQFKF